jgi:hypothetical protein
MRIIAFFVMTVAFVHAQEWEDTVTEGLLQAQADLAIGHEFFEMNVIASRDDLSTSNYGFMRTILDTHMEAYADMKMIADDTTAALDAIENTPASEQCLASVRQRWQIQISRNGQSLSRCIAVFNRSKEFSNFQPLDKELNDF